MLVSGVQQSNSVTYICVHISIYIFFFRFFLIILYYKDIEGFPGGAVVKNPPAGASLVAQWLRICLLMQGTRVRALVWEDPTCHGATRPVSHKY